jgi:hypothetical protein
MVKSQHITRLLLCISNLLHVKAFSSALPPAPQPTLPRNAEDVVRQAAKSISKAYLQDGKNLQSIRLPLSESMYSNSEEGFVADRAIGWQGGPQETYRYLSPMVSSLLKQIKMTDNTGGLAVKVSEQLLLDFDGSALQTSEHPAGALYDIQALLQPNTDWYYIKTIESIEKQFSNTEGKAKRLFLIINPAWRDKSSWGFFGAKKAQELILDRYETTYAVDQFIVRGRKVSLLKCYSDDWILFVDNDQDPAVPAERVAMFSVRPDYKDIDAALIEHLRS